LSPIPPYVPSGDGPPGPPGPPGSSVTVGTLAARPAAGPSNIGAQYYVTDFDLLTTQIGSGWVVTGGGTPEDQISFNYNFPGADISASYPLLDFTPVTTVQVHVAGEASTVLAVGVDFTISAPQFITIADLLVLLPVPVGVINLVEVYVGPTLLASVPSSQPFYP
jgi:hypothetical protein